MSGAVSELTLAHCLACRARSLPSDGPCPRCGSSEIELYAAPSEGVVLAATELVNPASGWASPHPLLLVELTDSVVALAVAQEPLAAVGSTVEVRREGDVYRARSIRPARERGEGESPRAGSADASFEPPR